MTLRRLFVLVRGLPLESRLKTELVEEATEHAAAVKTGRLEDRQAHFQPTDA